MSTITIGRVTLNTSNENKILFPKDGITKGDIINYYASMADIMLPFMQNRPISMQRFPEGIHQESFYQKDKSEFFPSWIDSVTVEKKSGGDTEYVIINNAATLVYLANLACLTPHLWLSSIPHLKKPDRIIFDLDPAPTNSFADVKEAAFALKELLEELGLTSFALLTGSKGIHVIVPIKPNYTYAKVRQFTKQVAEVLMQRHPDLYTINPRKEKRKKLLLIDYFRNGFGATGVAPYAVRAKDGAPVAAPVTWDELSRVKASNQFTIKTIKKRPHWKTIWQRFFELKQKL